MRSLTAVRSTVTECLIGSGLISKTVDSIFQLDASKYLQFTFLFALMPFFNSDALLNAVKYLLVII